MVVRTVLAPFERIGSSSSIDRPPVRAGGAKVLAAEGVRGFWRGNAIIFRVCPCKAINFAAFDAYRGLAVASRLEGHMG